MFSGFHNLLQVLYALTARHWTPLDCQTLWWEFYSLQAFNNYILYLKLVYLAFYFVSMVRQDIEFN